MTPLRMDPRVQIPEPWTVYLDDVLGIAVAVAVMFGLLREWLYRREAAAPRHKDGG